MSHDDALVDKVADFMHEQWASWWYNASLDLSTSKCVVRDKLADTPYARLSEEDKEKDREWARKLLEMLDGETSRSNETVQSG